nr:cocaine- and amphetamine-regulated transcript protein [Microcebus murinus]
MESPRLRLLPLLGAALLLLLPLLGTRAQEDAELQPRALDIYSAVEDASHEKELIEALQEVLKKLKSKRIPIYEKKYGQVPMDYHLIKLLFMGYLGTVPDQRSPKGKNWSQQSCNT